MRSSYTFENKQDFLVMTVTGDYHYWDFAEYAKIARRQCEEENINRILVDLILVRYSEIPTIELFFLGEILAETIRNRIKMAIVWTGDNYDRFLQRVATNRSARLRIFDLKKTAEFWLLYDNKNEHFDLFKR